MKAEIVREYGPFEGIDDVAGLTFDGDRVWFAAGGKIVALDPASGKLVRELAVAGHAGTAFDGRHLYQIAEDRIQKVDPVTGDVLASIPAPGRGGDSGLTWAEGSLWVGHYRERKIYEIDPATGQIRRTITSDRFVTGVSCVDGALWHGAVGDGKPSELRRLAPDGSVEEVLTVPVSAIAGVEGTGDGSFWCAGEKGKLRLVRRTNKN